MMIIGIDPGYDRLGVAVLEKENGKEKLLYSSCLTTSSELPFPERLKILGQKIEKILIQWPIKVMAIEKLFLTKNQKTATKISEVRGMLIYIAAKQGLKIFEYTPLEIKMTVTGFGKASKHQVMSMVQKLITLPTKKALDDEYDAIATGLTCLAREK